MGAHNGPQAGRDGEATPKTARAGGRWPKPPILGGFTRFLLAAVIGLGLLVFAVERWVDARPAGEANLKQGEAVVLLLKRYHADHGQYPPSLRQLVPKYAPAVPRLRGEARWEYDVRPDGSHFGLAFVSRGGDWTGSYDSEGEGWIVDDK